MTSFIRIIVVLLIAVAGGNIHCYAQADSTDIDDFMPREKVIFYDDFSDNKAGTFPLNWYILPCCGAKAYTSLRLCSVSRTGENAMVVAANDTPTRSTNDNKIEPKLKEKDYLPDSFTLQYDLKLSSEAAGPTLFFHTASPVLYSIDIYKKENGRWVITTYGENLTRETYIVGEFDAAIWHHFALSYYRRKIVCYLDDEVICVIPNVGFNPAGFILSADKTGSVSYTNVRVATGPYLTGEHYNFGKLFLADKFTTHSIHFDVKQSTIQAGSMEFIRKLAGWLKQNPTVRLEIDGHTDNDGKDADNMKLSQDRADEVKKQLVAYGINALRITTKGYGATQPVQPNSTPEGKAYNRRVEFIKH